MDTNMSKMEQKFKSCRDEECSALKLSGNTRITYELGEYEGKFAFRITKNKGGTFDDAWVELSCIVNCLEGLGEIESFKSEKLSSLYKSTNENTYRFLAAILRMEGLIKPENLNSTILESYHKDKKLNLSASKHLLAMPVEAFYEHIKAHCKRASEYLSLNEILDIS